MKKFILILALGLSSAVFIYPLLHELGHSLVAVILGARIKEITLYPVPSMLCNIENINYKSTYLIGLGGIIFPFLLSTVLTPSDFKFWYVNLNVRLISILYLSVSIFTIFGSQKALFENDDMVKVIEILGGGKEYFVFFVFVAYSSRNIKNFA